MTIDNILKDFRKEFADLCFPLFERFLRQAIRKSQDEIVPSDRSYSEVMYSYYEGWNDCVNVIEDNIEEFHGEEK